MNKLEMTTPAPEEELDVSDILHKLISDYDMWLEDPLDDQAGDFNPTITLAVAQILAWVDKRERLARIDELKRLYLVYGSKDSPASLDNLFSLGKKGEVAATPIKDRLSALTNSKGGSDE